MEDVNAKVAFITGGASGIGLGMAGAFVDAGMKVVLADVRQDHLDHALSGFSERGQEGSVHGTLLDVTDREGFARAADEAERHFGKVHVLCNNAGIGVAGPLAEARYDDWDWGLGVMVGGAVNGVQTFLPRMLEHGDGGHIVNTSSATAVVPIDNVAIYVTAKAALIGLSESMRSELAAQGIGVSCLLPGPVQTNIRESGKTRPERYMRDSGYARREQQLELRPNSPLWMTIEECGERVLEGIRRNDLYIFTHREFKEGAAQKFEAVLAAFPDEEIDAERADSIRYLLSNPIFSTSPDDGF
jgi:NAD(P)-dependent dehydrogenase (short-subunit alcohol dehydrogenase family)